MKKIGIISFFALFLLISCDNVEKEAQIHLEKAKMELKAGNYSEAKLQIDSIRTLYPKAFKARNEGVKLMQQIDLQEQRRNIKYLDSMMVVKSAKFDSIKANFVLEKNKEYQEVGNYFYPSQVVEKNIGRSFLRGQVNEMGEMSITSIYCAGGNIHHTSIKVINGDLFAETPMSTDIYETSDLGQNIEKADYKAGQDGGVINFISANKDSNLKLQFKGDKVYNTVMSADDRKAISELCELSKVLSGIEQIKKDKKESQLKIRFVEKKMQEDSDK